MLNSNAVTVKSFDELTKTELYAILALRIRVFCVEQSCPYQDIDDQDQVATHLFISNNDSISAYIRIIKDNHNIFHIGRVVVDADYRKYGLASKLINHGINLIQENKNAKTIISAQSYLTNFYQNLGFKSTGKYYLEDDIPHEQMELSAVSIALIEA